MIDTRYFRYFDWCSFFCTLSLLGIGLLFIFSTTYVEELTFSIFVKKQALGIISGLCIYFFFCIKDLRSLIRLGYFAYIGVLILLFYTSMLGFIGMGARRWISLYYFRFQPSELAKLFLPAFLGCYFFGDEITALTLPTDIETREFIFPLSMLGISTLLIIRQPDLGTGLILLFTGLLLLWLIGLSRKFLMISSIVCILAAPFFWQMLKPYQQQRVLVLLGYGDTNKEGYQSNQSKIAIGSGGLTGKGFLKGTQNKLLFLPEDHTDFIFSVICEEWGFLGALLVLGLYLLLGIRVLYIITQIPAPFIRIIAVGLLSHIMLSMCINIGMVTGLMPIVGIPLPLISYGISNLWVTLASLGLLNNIAIRRFYY